MFSVLAINVAAPLDPVVVSVIVSCFALNVLQLAELNAPLFVADAVGKLKVCVSRFAQYWHVSPRRG